MNDPNTELDDLMARWQTRPRPEFVSKLQDQLDQQLKSAPTRKGFAMTRRFALNLAAATLSLVMLAGLTAALLKPNPVVTLPTVTVPSAGRMLNPFSGTGWMLESLNGQETSRAWYLQFNEDGTFHGSGCDDYTGQYTVDGPNITLTFSVTPPPCLDDPTAADVYHDALASARTFSITPDNRLIFTDADDQPVATFTLYRVYPDVGLPVPSATPPLFPNVTASPTAGGVSGGTFAIIIGHRGTIEDRGWECADGISERIVLVEVIMLLDAQLRARGYNVIVFDHGDPHLQGFSGLAAIELHTGSCDDETPTGYNAGYVSSANRDVEDQNIALLQCFTDHYKLAMGLELNGATPMEQDGFDDLEIVDPQTPAIVFEIGALGTDHDLVMDFERVASALADGLIACTDARGTPDHPTATVPPSELGTSAREIVFMSNRDGNYEIYTMTLADQQVKRLTFDEATDQNPAWSPSGNSIAFASDRDGTMQLYLMAPDASSVIQLTDDPALAASAFTWSPDGLHIAFMGWTGDEASLYLLTLTTDLSVELIAQNITREMPSWSPDSQRLVFASFADAKLYEYDLASKTVQPLSILPPEAQARRVMWMPDGQHLAVEGFFDNPSTETTALENMIAITDLLGNSMLFSAPQGTPILIGPSPDGRSVAFWQLGSGGIFLTIASADGSFVQTAHKVSDFDVAGAAWTFDSQGIVFSAGQMQDFGLYYFDVNGFGITTLLVDGAYNALPSVRP